MSSDAEQMGIFVRQRKRIAMGSDIDGSHFKHGGKAKKYAKGGQVIPESHQPDNELIGAYPESKVRNLPAKGNKPKLTKPEPHAVATLKKGGMAKKPSLMIAIAVGKKGTKNY